MTTVKRWLLCCSIALVAAGAPVVAPAQMDPAKPVRIVVPFPAGGVTDLIARAMVPPMAQSLGQPVVIDNRPGADGIVAADAVAKAPADGHTLYLGTATSLSFAPAVRKSLPFDPVADFTPVGLVCEFGFFVYAHPGLPARDMRELIAFAKANPAKLNHGTANATSLLTSTVLAQSQKVEFTQVPYKGDAQLAPDLLSGRVQMAVAAGAHLPHVKQGALRVLVTTLPARSSLLPDVPTWSESGLPPLGIAPWGGLFGPANMPRDTVERLSRALAAALASPEVRQLAAGAAIQIRISTPEELAAFLKDQLLVWRHAARAAGMQPE